MELLKKIEQKDRSTFSITWSDGAIYEYTLAQVQSRCPCAACSKGNALVEAATLSATRIFSVGRYALRFLFTSGCSAGIYDFSLLRQIGEEAK